MEGRRGRERKYFKLYQIAAEIERSGTKQEASNYLLPNFRLFLPAKREKELFPTQGLLLFLTYTKLLSSLSLI